MPPKQYTCPRCNTPCKKAECPRCAQEFDASMKRMYSKLRKPVDSLKD